MMMMMMSVMVVMTVAMADLVLAMAKAGSEEVSTMGRLVCWMRLFTAE